MSGTEKVRGISWRGLSQQRSQPQVWRLENAFFQVKKTYCVSISLPSTGDAHASVWRNFVFADLAGGSAPAHAVSCVQETLDGSDWRRGYYGDRTWDIKKPKRGLQNQMMLRFDAQMSYDIEDEMAQWERTTPALVRAQVAFVDVCVLCFVLKGVLRFA